MLHHEYVDVLARSVDLLRLWSVLVCPLLSSWCLGLSDIIWLLNSLLQWIELLLEILDLLLVCSLNKIYDLSLLHLPDIIDDCVLFVLVYLLHGCLEESSCESGHVTDSTVQKEFLDDLLVAEYLAEPNAELYILFERFADNANEVWYLGSYICSECHCQGESYDVLKNFKLVALSTSILYNL